MNFTLPLLKVDIFKFFRFLILQKEIQTAVFLIHLNPSFVAIHFSADDFSENLFLLYSIFEQVISQLILRLIILKNNFFQL